MKLLFVYIYFAANDVDNNDDEDYDVVDDCLLRYYSVVCLQLAFSMEISNSTQTEKEIYIFITCVVTNNLLDFGLFGSVDATNEEFRK